MDEKIYKYPGVDVTVTYDLKRCIHAAACVKGSPAVFDPNKKPWIDPDQADAAQVTEVIMKCPTGALKFVPHEGEAEAVPAENTVSIDPDGPLYARGNIQIKTSDGTVVLEDTRVALCRCGASRNKPICDGSHTKAGFVDPGNIGEPKMREGEPGENNMLTIVLANNGPLLFEGALNISSATKEQSVEGVKGALCRCGASANKPFCDGAHKAIGFES